MNYIPRKDYMDYAENIESGQQIHVNHTDCTAGEDTKRRLYIKRTDDGRTILAYCHNCGLSGSFSEDYTGLLKSKTKGVASPTIHNKQIGDGDGVRKTYEVTQSGGLAKLKRCYSDQSKWSKEARLWLARYGITEKEVETYGIKYDPKYDTVVLPVSRYGELVGWQERTFNKEKPKYITRSIGHKTLWWFSDDYETLLSPPAPTVIVEDILSGIKCARFAPTLSLLGGFLKDEALSYVLTERESRDFIIFLDNDNRPIKQEQLRIKGKLEQLGCKATIIKLDKDPKECSNAELERLLRIPKEI